MNPPLNRHKNRGRIGITAEFRLAEANLRGSLAQLDLLRIAREHDGSLSISPTSAIVEDGLTAEVSTRAPPRSAISGEIFLRLDFREEEFHEVEFGERRDAFRAILHRVGSVCGSGGLADTFYRCEEIVAGGAIEPWIRVSATGDITENWTDPFLPPDATPWEQKARSVGAPYHALARTADLVWGLNPEETEGWIETACAEGWLDLPSSQLHPLELRLSIATALNRRRRNFVGDVGTSGTYLAPADVPRALWKGPDVAPLFAYVTRDGWDIVLGARVAACTAHYEWVGQPSLDEFRRAMPGVTSSLRRLGLAGGPRPYLVWGSIPYDAGGALP